MQLIRDRRARELVPAMAVSNVMLRYVGIVVVGRYTIVFHEIDPFERKYAILLAEIDSLNLRTDQCVPHGS